MPDTEPMIVVVCDHPFNIVDSGVAPAHTGNTIGRHATIALKAGENAIPARLRDHWALKAHGVVEKTDAA